MDFKFYTDQELEQVKLLQEEVRKARLKMYKGKTKADYTHEEREALILSKEFQEEAAKKRTSREKILDIYRIAEKRYIPFVLKNGGEDFINLIKERISVYTDYVGISFLKTAIDNGHEAFSFFSLRDEIEGLVADIYIKQAGENPELKDIFSKVQQLIINKAIAITSLYKELYESGELTSYLNGSDEIEGQQSFFDICNQKEAEENKQQLKKAKKLREKAAEIGALMTIDKRIATLSADALKDAFNAFSIMKLPGSPKDFDFDETGKLMPLSLNDMQLENQSEIYTAFLGAIFQGVCMTDLENYNENNFTFYVTGIYNELGLNSRKIESVTKDEKTGKPIINRSDLPINEARVKDLMQIIQPFDQLVGRTPDGSYYRVLSFSKYDADSDTMTLNCPYLYRVKDLALRLQEKENHSPLNRLFHSSVAKEKNQEAVELANRILIGLLNRGTTPNKKGLVTWEAKYITLIQDCPQFAKALEIIEKNSEKFKTQKYNTRLRNTFKAAFQIIEKNSDAPNYYKDLKIDKQIPTKSVLRNKLKITHKGKNEEFTGSLTL